MPEGPEVEAARSAVQHGCVGKKIVKAIVADDTKVVEGCTPDELRAAFEGRHIQQACRKAKYLWFEMAEGPPHPMFHFGMTGHIMVEGHAAAQYKRVKVEEGVWPPKFCKLELHFEDGTKMAFADARRFARMWLKQNPMQQEPVTRLGFDVITELPDLDTFKSLLAARARGVLRIKALLLDQAFTAGIGNWVADEVLYQARIHPEQPVVDMSEGQVEALHAAIKHVCETAVAAGAESDLFPKTWIFHYRWTGKQASSVNGHRIEFVTAGGRTSAFVPALQKLAKGSARASGGKAGAKSRGKKGAAAAAAPEADADPLSAEGAAVGVQQEVKVEEEEGGVVVTAVAAAAAAAGGRGRKRKGAAAAASGASAGDAPAAVKIEPAETDAAAAVAPKGRRGRKGGVAAAAAAANTATDDHDAAGADVNAAPAAAAAAAAGGAGDVIMVAQQTEMVVEVVDAESAPAVPQGARGRAAGKQAGAPEAAASAPGTKRRGRQAKQAAPAADATGAEGREGAEVATAAGGEGSAPADAGAGATAADAATDGAEGAGTVEAVKEEVEVGQQQQQPAAGASSTPAAAGAAKRARTSRRR